MIDGPRRLQRRGKRRRREGGFSSAAPQGPLTNLPAGKKPAWHASLVRSIGHARLSQGLRVRDVCRASASPLRGVRVKYSALLPSIVETHHRVFFLFFFFQRVCSLFPSEIVRSFLSFLKSFFNPAMIFEFLYNLVLILVNKDEILRELKMHFNEPRFIYTG